MAIAREIQWLTPALAFWEAYEPSVKCDLTSSALVTAEGLVLVDPIALPAPALAELAAAAPPAAILLTNGNHSRTAAAFREKWGIRICATAGAAAELDLAPDVILADGDLTVGGLRVVALPAAGPGEAAFIGAGVAFIGDALIHLGSHGFALLPEKYRANAAALPNELRKLLSYDFHILTFAHGTPLTLHARQRLENLLA